jgi:nickel/cobalt exporter
MNELYNTFIRAITGWQYELNRMVAANLRTLEGDAAVWGVLTILGIALLYGIVHAAGPGHGKALVGAYFLKRGGSYKEAFKMGYMIAVVHALSALGVTLVVYYLLTAVFSKTFKEVSHLSMLVSAGLIIVVGCYLLYEAYAHRNAAERAERVSKKSDFAVAFSAGVVPCPGVMTLTLFSISLGHVAVGIASALVMSVGMGLTISLAGALSVGARKRGGTFFDKYGYLLELVAAMMILTLGIFLLLATLGASQAPQGRFG